MYYKKWNKCIDTLIKHLNLKSSTWKDERAASMRYIARSYIALKRYEEAKMWYELAIKEAPYLKEAYIELMLLYYNLNKYKEAIKYGIKSLKIKNDNLTYINEIFSKDETVDDILSICYYYIGNKKEGLKHIKKALRINPNNKRIIENKKFFE